MSNKCTCFGMPFAPECSYCHNRLIKYVNKRDLEIIKIKEKNSKENKCKCVYMFNICLYACECCTNDFRIWDNRKN